MRLRPLLPEMQRVIVPLLIMDMTANCVSPWWLPGIGTERKPEYSISFPSNRAALAVMNDHNEFLDYKLMAQLRYLPVINQ